MRHRNAVQREREAAERQAERRKHARTDRMLAGEQRTKYYLDACQHTQGPDHGYTVEYDADTGWYMVEHRGKRRHLHAAELVAEADLMYAKFHEAELDYEDDK